MARSKPSMPNELESWSRQKKFGASATQPCLARSSHVFHVLSDAENARDEDDPRNLALAGAERYTSQVPPSAAISICLPAMSAARISTFTATSQGPTALSPTTWQS